MREYREGELIIYESRPARSTCRGVAESETQKVKIDEIKYVKS